MKPNDDADAVPPPPVHQSPAALNPGALNPEM